MAFNYMIPVVGVIPEKYDCTLDPPFDNLAGCITEVGAEILWRVRVYRNAELLESFEQSFEGSPGSIENAPGPIQLKRTEEEWREDARFFESDFISVSGEPTFSANTPPPFYTVYTSPGRKSFISDNAYKFSQPTIISQVAAYGRYLDAYAPLLIDRTKDYEESVALTNPYNRDNICRILASDGRKIEPIRVPALSTRIVPLSQLLDETEDRWQGRIQLTAFNRLITFNVKHALSDRGIINDFEHLDPFRAEPTHLPAFQIFRQWIGEKLKLRGMIGS